MKKTFLWVPFITFISLLSLTTGIVYGTTSNVEVTGQIGVQTVPSSEPEESAPPTEETTAPEETPDTEETPSTEGNPSTETSSEERELANISQNLPQTNAAINPWIAAAGGVLLLIVFVLFMRKKLKSVYHTK
ncbi:MULTISPECIES: LPXTG cell wall anchor domain-containing protein [unclassified Enterococcus]|jgi:LPXTG-motif cell wall-anchored protein|uniref:LPXTG cell wall anchor domain-containing protein n=1 Tax=unclassified Enterococcus TaxID=2608891 RepID=UPI003D28ED21